MVSPWEFPAQETTLGQNPYASSSHLPYEGPGLTGYGDEDVYSDDEDDSEMEIESAEGTEELYPDDRSGGRRDGLEEID